jgi:TonB family protein
MRFVNPGGMTTGLGRVVGLALWPLAALADPAAPTPAPPTVAPSAAQPSSAALAYYPPAAKAAGVEGEARLRCERDAHVALRNCQLVSETPAGQGFGAAALALAAQSPDNPKVDIADAAARPPIELTVRFQLHPQPQVVPDLTQMGHVVVQPQIVTRPTRAQIQAAYPARAFSDGVDGAVVIDCLADAKGALSSCQVYGERPTGYGFGAAALDLATDYQLKPRLIDGEPTSAEVQIPVQFQAQDPTAPLELGTTPAK